MTKMSWNKVRAEKSSKAYRNSWVLSYFQWWGGVGWYKCHDRVELNYNSVSWRLSWCLVVMDCGLDNTSKWWRMESCYTDIDPSHLLSSSTAKLSRSLSIVSMLAISVLSTISSSVNHQTRAINYHLPRFTFPVTTSQSELARRSPPIGGRAEQPGASSDSTSTAATWLVLAHFLGRWMQAEWQKSCHTFFWLRLWASILSLQI